VQVVGEWEPQFHSLKALEKKATSQQWFNGFYQMTGEVGWGAFSALHITVPHRLQLFSLRFFLGCIKCAQTAMGRDHLAIYGYLESQILL
jgi:hypothetical protein